MIGEVGVGGSGAEVLDCCGEDVNCAVAVSSEVTGGVAETGEDDEFDEVAVVVYGVWGRVVMSLSESLVWDEGKSQSFCSFRV